MLHPRDNPAATFCAAQGCLIGQSVDLNRATEQQGENLGFAVGMDRAIFGPTVFANGICRGAIGEVIVELFLNRLLKVGR